MYESINSIMTEEKANKLGAQRALELSAIHLFISGESDTKRALIIKQAVSDLINNGKFSFSR